MSWWRGCELVEGVCVGGGCVSWWRVCMNWWRVCELVEGVCELVEGVYELVEGVYELVEGLGGCVGVGDAD